MTNPNVAAMLTQHSERSGDKAALIDLTRGRVRRLSYRELAMAAAGFAEVLRARGVEAGDRVLLFVPMSAELYVTLLGVLHLGATAVFVDAWADRKRLDRAVEIAAPKAFIGSRKAQLLRLISPAIRRLPLHLTADERHSAPRDYDLRAAELPPDAPALVTLTSGSTGEPRAAARSHAFLWAQHRALAGLMRFQADDVDLTTLPIFVLNNLALAITSVLPPIDPRRPSKFDPAALFRIIEREGVTTVGGSPAFFERLCEWANTNGHRLSVRALFAGGAPVTPSLARKIVQCAAGEATVVYGSTEAEPISGITMAELISVSQEETAAAGLCVGKPVPEVEIRLMRATDEPIAFEEGVGVEWDVAAGEIGEIVAAGEHVLDGYLNDPEADRRSKISGSDRIWHRTGDAARLDSEGRLWLQGRVAERVHRDGRTYWPLPVELAAMDVDGVTHAAYVGTSRAILCVETPARLAPKQIQRLFAAAGDAPIDGIIAVRRIPRDPRHASKTDVSKLRKLMAQMPPDEFIRRAT